MTAGDMQALIDAEPFRPFRIHMASGRTFDIRHPEMIKVGRTFATVFVYTREEDRFFEHVELLGLLLIGSVSFPELSLVSDGG